MLEKFIDLVEENPRLVFFILVAETVFDLGLIAYIFFFDVGRRRSSDVDVTPYGRSSYD